MNPRNLRDHIEKLNVFAAICRAKSFHRAARTLGVTQPSLSQAVKILEEILEQKLFIRSQKGVEMTQAGQNLYFFTERLISEVDGVENRIRSPDQPMAGSLNIGAYTTVTTYLLPKFLLQVSKKYPQLNLGMVSLKAPDLMSALTSRRCHFVIGTTKLEQKTVTQIELYQDHFGFFKTARLQSKNPPLILVADAKDERGRTIEEILNSSHLPRMHRYYVDTFEAVKALVTEGLGIGVLPHRFAARSASLKSTSLPKLGKNFGTHRFYCSYLAQDATDIRISKVVAELIQYVSTPRD